ncbi:MAG TPA: hypothetical protein ENK19_07530 [Acidobacteria bacterium]|nr:hypothetical protein [Acidobacteriota bacterium]
MLRTNVGSDPAFTLRLFRGGRVKYIGHSNIEPLGPRAGKISPWYFRQLASLVQEIGYRKMETLYASKFTDLPGYIFVVAWDDGTRKVILDYGFAGPRTLWALGMTLENLLHEIQWDAPAAHGGSGTQPAPTPGAPPER